jgi:hypothetical protein
MAKLALDQPVGTMTVGDLRELIREERRKEYYIDKEGYLVFLSEEAFAHYLDKQGKLPSLDKCVGRGKKFISGFSASQRIQR